MTQRLRLPARRALVACAMLLGVAPLARAQRLLVPHDQPRALVALVDVGAGALVDSDWLDVESTALPTPSSGSLRAAERVRGEVWVAGSLWLYRYDAQTHTFISSFGVGAPIRSIECQSRRVVVTTSDFLQTYDFDGSPRDQYPIFGAGDTLELRSSMLVAIKDESRVDRYAFDGTWLGEFAGPTIPTPLGVLSKPQQLAQRANGNVLICGDVRVYEFTLEGEFVAEYDIGPFEGGVAETANGRLFVPLGNGVALHDAVTGTTTRVGGLFFGQGRTAAVFDSGLGSVVGQGESSSRTTCAGARNSTGYAARAGLLGSAQVADRLFSVFGERLPVGAPVVVALAPDAIRLPLAGGMLCLSPGSLTLAPEVLMADASGKIFLPLVRGPQALALFPPGTTWHVQLLYRDAADLMLSDAVRVTFAD